MPIQGTCVATFDNEVPILLHGEWNVSVSVPVFRSYGQGDGSPGSGYNGAALGTKKSGAGSFTFIVDKGGIQIQRIIQRGLMGLFTIDWPLGDTLQGASSAKAIDCHFDSLDFKVNNPEGSFTISGSMTAGDVTGPAFEVPTS